MTDITSWLGSGDPPPLDPFLDLSDTFGHTESHTIQSMDVSWLGNEISIDGYSLFDGCDPLNPIGPDKSAIQTQSELVSSNFLQETSFPGLKDPPGIFVGESHNSILHGAGPQVTVNSDADQTTTNEQRKKRPGSPTLHSPQPRKKTSVATSKSSKHRAKLSSNAKKVLEDFFKVNIYPEPSDVAGLVEQTGVENQQIKTWFRNQRARKLNVDMSGGSEDIPQSPCGPSEQTFATALADIPRIDPKSLMEKYLGVPLDQDHRMPTTATPVAERGEYQAAAGSESSWSSCGSQNSWSSRRGRRKANGPRRTGLYMPISVTSPFHCTFCGEGLKDRYQWKRHEETKHAPRTGWICKDTACANKPIEDSIFFREDLFTQHRAKHTPHEQASTKFEIVSANPIPEAHHALQCGFCGDRLPDWAERVDHIAAHFEKGANFSSWWLKRAEFFAETKGPPIVWPHKDFKAVLPNSVFCIYCKRLYPSLEDAEARHQECTVWSCGLFEGILAAYEELEDPFWSCTYCDEIIVENSPDHSKRLSHLIMEHAYRSCTPGRFVELSHFQDHLMSHHKALLGKARTLESACRLTRRSQFRCATDFPSIDLTQLNARCFSYPFPYVEVDIFGTFQGDLRFAFLVAILDPVSPHNTISLEYVRLLRQIIDLQMDESGDVVLDTSAGHVGHVVIQWAGVWGAQWRSVFLPVAHGVHTTRFFVVDHGSKLTLAFGRAAMEEHNMVEKHPPLISL